MFKRYLQVRSAVQVTEENYEYLKEITHGEGILGENKEDEIGLWIVEEEGSYSSYPSDTEFVEIGSLELFREYC